MGPALEIMGYTLYQDFWGRVGVEWQVRLFPDVPADSGQADYSLDAALLDSEYKFVPETESQPIPALVWRPPTSWQPDIYYALRTLPRHTTSPFSPAIGTDIDVFGPGIAPCRVGCALRATPVVIPRESPPGWMAAGEWRLENHHARRGDEGWRQFDPPAELASESGVWEIAELRAWDVEESDRELRVSLTWQALEPPTAAVHRFTHLVPREGAAVPFAQADDILGGRHPATEWVEGEWVEETFTLPLPPAGAEWRLLVGLYDPVSGNRFEVSPDAGDRAFQFYP
jgi:hypothetical protein